ncbi:MAG: caspase family protein [Spirochaetales bacterium]|uniref:Caspase family protein n=1 Tax=Candidatus Thalassospirochaeta sargassi TaxID=3119039 RepID=A0AAJ1IFL5_9SPIO|nr:caspase family protein [Spirochaetales bacterium]
MRKLIFALTLSAAAFLFFNSCSEPDIPQGWAVIYGVEVYPFNNSLTYCVDDAEALAELLDTKGWNVTLRTDSDASLAQLQTDIDSIETMMADDDRFLFYFSGHGSYLDLGGEESDDDYDELLILSGALTTVFNFDSGTASAEDVLNVTVSDDSLAEILSVLPTINKTVIIDACNSGGFIGDGYTFRNIASDYVLGEAEATFAPIEAMKLYAGYTVTDEDLNQSEFAILTASGEDEDSYETSQLGHGVFTYFLLQTASEADYNFDGYISLTEAWKYTSLSIDSFWNESQWISEENQYMANVAAFPVDPVLFESD